MVLEFEGEGGEVGEGLCRVGFAVVVETVAVGLLDNVVVVHLPPLVVDLVLWRVVEPALVEAVFGDGDVVVYLGGGGVEERLGLEHAVHAFVVLHDDELVYG